MKYLDIADGAPIELPAQGALPATAHVFDGESVDAVNAALAAGRPLLVRGEPGTGKSQLARAAAVGLGRALVSTVTDARTEARDLLWSFDAVARLAEAQVQGALAGRDEAAVRNSLKQERFLAPGPLWWTFDWASAEEQARAAGAAPSVVPEGWEPGQGTVLLIDEIDKADAAVPNGLLEGLGGGAFRLPGRSGGGKGRGGAAAGGGDHQRGAGAPRPLPSPLLRASAALAAAAQGFRPCADTARQGALRGL